MTPRALEGHKQLARALRLLVFPLAIVAFLAPGTESALAAEAHPLITTVGPLDFNTGIAIDESNGNVFVADATGGGSGKVDVFGPEGGAPAGGVMTTEINGFHFEVTTLAIDNSATSPSKGALYVANTKFPEVDKYALNLSKEYEYLCQINGKGSGCTAAGGTGDPFFGVPTQAGRTFWLTTDPKGDLFVADEESKAVYEFGPAGEDLATIPIELNGESKAPGGRLRRRPLCCSLVGVEWWRFVRR
jgi:hypothetical protein